jgi:hypothetical protein
MHFYQFLHGKLNGGVLRNDGMLFGLRMEMDLSRYFHPPSPFHS